MITISFTISPAVLRFSAGTNETTKPLIHSSQGYTQIGGGGIWPGNNRVIFLQFNPIRVKSTSMPCVTNEHCPARTDLACDMQCHNYTCVATVSCTSGETCDADAGVCIELPPTSAPTGGSEAPSTSGTPSTSAPGTPSAPTGTPVASQALRLAMGPLTVVLGLALLLLAL